MGALAIPLLLAGTGVAVAGQIQQAKAAERESKNRAIIAEHNAQVAKQEGEAQARKFEREAEIQQRRGAEIQAAQTAAYGKAGVTGRGSPLTVKLDTAKQLELDRLSILQDAATARARGESGAQAQQLQAAAYRSKGRNARTAGLFSAVGTGLTGFGNAGVMNQQLGNKPLFGIL